MRQPWNLPNSSLFLTNSTPLSKKTAEYLVYIINLFTFAHIKMRDIPACPEMQRYITIVKLKKNHYGKS